MSDATRWSGGRLPASPVPGAPERVGMIVSLDKSGRAGVRRRAVIGGGVALGAAMLPGAGPVLAGAGSPGPDAQVQPESAPAAASGPGAAWASVVVIATPEAPEQLTG